MKKFLVPTITLLIGILIGGYLFSRSLPRSFLAFHQCERCFSTNDLAGFFTSMAIQNVPSLIPLKELESEKSIAIRHPKPGAPFHFVIFPKKDIQNIGTLTPEDLIYVEDILATAGALIRKYNLQKYTLQTSGPGVQLTTYLHFHLFGH